MDVLKLNMEKMEKKNEYHVKSMFSLVTQLNSTKSEWCSKFLRIIDY